MVSDGTRTLWRLILFSGTLTLLKETLHADDELREGLPMLELK